MIQPANRGSAVCPRGPVAAIFVLIACRGAPAQVARDAGSIAGTALSATERIPLPSAVVTVCRPGGEALRSTVTSPDGGFLVSWLAPGKYEISVSAPFYSALSGLAVEIRVGEVTRVLVSLQPVRAVFRVEATASLLPIDFRNTQQAAAIDQTSIQNLPINRRNYLDLALLAPGVVDAGSLVEQNDYRPPLTPASGLGFSGNNGRGNSFMIDGISIDGASGNVRPSLPQSAVQEFQVNRNSYSAELGGASGGVVNIVSRSGGDTWHGDVFALLRDRALQARNYFDPARAAFTRVQSGADVSGPLRKDRSFVFGSFERLDRHEAVFVPILQDSALLSTLTPGQKAITGFLAGSDSGALRALAAQLNRALVPSQNPRVADLFRSNSGTFPFSAHVNQMSVRLDHRWKDDQQAFLRANFTSDSEANTRFGALVGLSNGSSSKWLDRNIVAGNTWSMSPRWIWVSRLAFAWSRFRILPNDPIGPELVIEGYGQFGRNSLYPLDQRERYLEAVQTFQYAAPRHTLKFGADLRPVHNSSDIDSYFSGRFIFGTAIPLSVALDRFPGAPGLGATLASAFQAGGRPDLSRALAEPITSLQAFSLGLPLAYFQGFGNPAYEAWRKNYAGFVEDNWRVHPSLTLNVGLRYQADIPNAIRPVNYFSPRFGFAYAPGNSSRTVVRGGYGIFRDWVMPPIPFGQVQINRSDVTLMFMPITGIPGIINPQTGQTLTSADIYQSLLARGVLGSRVIVPADLIPLGVPPGFRFPTAGGVQGDYTSPYSQQASLQVERSWGSLTGSAGVEASRSAHLWRVRDHNLIQIGTRPNGWPLVGRIDPLLVNDYYYESAANAWYSALVLQVSRRFSRYWSVSAHYTLSRAIDEVTDFNLEYEPQNPFDARADRALSAFHQKHRFVADAVLASPWTTPCSRSKPACLVAWWTLSTVLRANSSRPFNVLAGVDNVGDGEVTNHRPLGLGRNVGIGPDFVTWDLRLKRTAALYRDRVRLEFTAEAFNLMNRTNFQSINSVVGDVPLSALPRRLIGVRGDPTRPFSFTAAYDPREVQIGLHVAF